MPMTTASAATSAPKPSRSTTGGPATVELAVTAPTQNATSPEATPRSGRWSGVNAVTCPYAQTSQSPAIAKSPTMRTQPDDRLMHAQRSAQDTVRSVDEEV